MNSPANLLQQGQEWLDGHGTKAWVAAMVLGFIFLWPVGLILLFYMIGTNRMGKCGQKRKFGRRGGFSATGNTVFDSYREETLKRLEDEQSAFRSFLDELRSAKDRTEFDSFMNSRKDANETPASAT